jgi:uncharacterized membrane protein YhaH (DUF805 family)
MRNAASIRRRWVEPKLAARDCCSGWGKGAPMDFKKFYFSLEGRVNRKQWWLWLVLPGTVISILLGFVDMATGNFNPEAGIGLFSGVFGLLSLIPAIIVHIKRFHDRDKSGWWVLIVLIPIIGAIWLLIELGFLKGTPGPNQFGSPVTD